MDRGRASSARRTRPGIGVSGSGPGWGERTIGLGLAACTGVLALVSIGILGILLWQAGSLFLQVSVLEFLTETRWTPLFREKHFGILPLLWGSLLVTGGAAVLALPTGLLSAIFLSEYARPRVRAVLKLVLETLAGIPTVVYGYLALTLITPLLQALLPGVGAFNAASAALALAIMILPTVASLSEDAMRGVPRDLRCSAYALGATRMETVTRVVIPAALPGIAASFVLALSRAIGETMVVAVAAGSTPQLTVNPLEPIQAMTAFILQAGQEKAGGSLGYHTLFAVGMTLFLITSMMNGVSQWIISRSGRRRP